MVKLGFIKKKVEEGEKKEKEPLSKIKEAPEPIDMDQVEKIVQRMKKKYKAEGVEFEEVSGKLKELRGIIAEGKAAQLEVQTVEELGDFKAPFIRRLGLFYLKMRKLLEPIAKFFLKQPSIKQVEFYLYSANMPYSIKQWIAITLSAAMIAFFIGLVAALIIFTVINVPIVIRAILIPVTALCVFMFVTAIGLLVPQTRAQARGDEVSRELPFALRHMSTELRAGIGLYRTIQAIATAGYGVLSDEFGRVISEIEEGTDTKVALRHLALRTQSKALRNALMHVIRALKTGGNLSDIMNDIADDVSFELRMRIRDFAERMNFFGVIFIFAAIVFPVMISILGGIKNTPLAIGTAGAFGMLPLGPVEISIIYLVAMPLILSWLLMYIVASQPKV